MTDVASETLLDRAEESAPRLVKMRRFGPDEGSTLPISLASGAVGLTIGTIVKPQNIGLMFGIVVVPITFFGCVYYPWAALYPIRWLQMGVLINPIVYMSEGLRSALTPGPHMPPLLILTMLVFFLVLLTWLGIRGFLRRVIG